MWVAVYLAKSPWPGRPKIPRRESTIDVLLHGNVAKLSSKYAVCSQLMSESLLFAVKRLWLINVDMQRLLTMKMLTILSPKWGVYAAPVRAQGTWGRKIVWARAWEGELQNVFCKWHGQCSHKQQLWPLTWDLHMKDMNVRKGLVGKTGVIRTGRVNGASQYHNCILYMYET